MSERQGARENFLPERGDAVIAVMGMTGSGKSQFISKFHTNRPVKIGKGLESCTGRVDIYRCHDAELGVFWMLDTPGFNDTYRTDADVLRDIVDWLNRAYLRRIQLTGILYVHPIHERRMGAKAIASLKTFQSLCGEEAFRKVVLVTTFWDETSPEDAADRVQQLEQSAEYWKLMIDQGSRVFRHDDNATTAKNIVSYLLSIRSKLEPGTDLKISKEMIDGNKKLSQTEAGQIMMSALEEQRKFFEEQLDRLKTQFEKAMTEHDQELQQQLRDLQKDNEEKQQRNEQDRLQMHKDFRDLSEWIKQQDKIDDEHDAKLQESYEKEEAQLRDAIAHIRGQEAKEEEELQNRLIAMRIEQEYLEGRRHQRSVCTIL